MKDCRSFVEVLRKRTERHPLRPAFLFLDSAAAETVWTYSALEMRARVVAAFLQERLEPGDRVLLCYPPGIEFLAGFFGCLFAGMIAVPVYPPRMNRSIDRLNGISQDANPQLVLSTSDALASLARGASEPTWQTDPPWVATDLLPDSLSEDWKDPNVSGELPAFLQYTSGSTGSPRGVVVTHGNLLANQPQIGECFEHRENIPYNVSWLPVYHDMGLIGNVLHPVYIGAPLVQLSPLDVLQRPIRWLEAISRYHAHTSGGPNFIYDLCVKRVPRERLESLDLRSWRVAYVGAEPIRAGTLDDFVRHFAPCGFDANSFLPCYGLAEATLFVTGGRGPRFLDVCPTALENGEVRPVEEAFGRTLVACGEEAEDSRVEIVDPESQTIVDSDQVGEIWVQGPQVARGYWGNAEATESTFQARLSDGSGPFLRTGDLGFRHGRKVYVTGRLKDLIIIDGRNHYPQDVEWVVQQCNPALRSNAGAAFAIEVDGTRNERLVIVQEVERTQLRTDRERIIAAIRRAVAEHHDVSVYDVVLLGPNAVPRTSSGKIQRSRCRQLYLEGQFKPVLQTTDAAL